MSNLLGNGISLTTTNAGGTNGFTCFPKYGGDRDNKVLVTQLRTFANVA
jgi:hypothetical protein